MGRYGEHYCELPLQANMYEKSCGVTWNDCLDLCAFEKVLQPSSITVVVLAMQ